MRLSQPIRATLAWPDMAGALAFQHAVVELAVGVVGVAAVAVITIASLDTVLAMSVHAR